MSLSTRGPEEDISELDAAVARLQKRLHGNSLPSPLNDAPQATTSRTFAQASADLSEEPTAATRSRQPTPDISDLRRYSRSGTPSQDMKPRLYDDPARHHDRDVTNPFIEVPLQQTHTSSSYSHPSTSSYSPYGSYSELSPSDYDPEQYAPDTTPGKLYSQPRKPFPRSRSATPSEAPLLSQRMPSSGPPGLTRRIFSSGKENIPPDVAADPIQSRTTSRSYPHEVEIDDYDETEKLQSDAVGGVGTTPVVDTETTHYGLPPRRQKRRRRSVKKLVPLTHGNFVVDLDIPSNMVMPEKARKENLSVRYTGVTCDPDEFESKHYFLRQNVSGRETEIAVVITMYNEDEILLCRTLYGVMRNISELCARKSSRTWGPDAWKKVVVVIVADGRRSVHPRVLDCLSILGVYQSGPHMKNSILGERVTAHLFEYTTTMGLDPDLHFQLAVPTQIIFCLKEKNAKKINSHRWFFNAFCKMLQPNVCILLDVGTRPGPKSLYHIWKTFDISSNVGGACGEIAAYKGRWWRGLLNPLVAAQNFEYKMSNILDKPLESMFGWITVLPGAFSAYRYIALQNDDKGEGPLASYFKGEIIDGKQHDIFTSNMYLAEDRILCFELVAKKGSDYVLRYVKNAVGETDVPSGLPEFIGQRRRWLNGSLFASLYSIAHLPQILRADHATGRKIVLVFESFYNIINMAFSWLAIGNYYLFFTILTSSLGDPSIGASGLQFFNDVVQYIFGVAVAACFLFSMGNKPRASVWKYKSVSLFFALVSAYMIIAAVVCAVHVAGSNEHALYAQMKLSIVSTFGMWVASSLLAFDPWHLFTSGLAYMLMSPTYIIVLNTYAFGNLDDISWGTKVIAGQQPENDLGVLPSSQAARNAIQVELPSEPQDTDSRYFEALENIKTKKPIQKYSGDDLSEQEAAAKDYYANIRTNVLLAWVLTNGLLVVGVLSQTNSSRTFSSGNEGSVARGYMTTILVFVAMTSAVRFAGSTAFLIVRWFTG